MKSLLSKRSISQEYDEKWVFYENVQCKRQWIDKDTSPKVELQGKK